MPRGDKTITLSFLKTKTDAFANSKGEPSHLGLHYLPFDFEFGLTTFFATMVRGVATTELFLRAPRKKKKMKYSHLCRYFGSDNFFFKSTVMVKM